LQAEFDCQAGSRFRIRGIRSSEGQVTPHLSKRITVEGMHLFVIECFKDLSYNFIPWHISEDLIWLRLRNATAFYIPSSLSLRRLRVMEIEGESRYLKALFDNFDHDVSTSYSVV